MHNKLKYLIAMAACALFARYTPVQSVSDIRGPSQSVALADDEAAPIFGIKIPSGYRDWRLISVAHEEGNLNDLRAVRRWRQRALTI